MLYLPFGGLAVLVSALAALALSATRRGAWERVLLAAAAATKAATTVAMVGLAATYAARGAADREALQAFAEAVPPDLLEKGFFLIPIDRSDPLLPENPALGSLLPGVFETSWSTGAAVAEVTGRTGLNAVTANRWVVLTIASEDAAHLRVQGWVVPIDLMLLFAFGSEGVEVCEAVTVPGADGATREVALPLGRAAAQVGAPTLPLCAAEAP